MKLVPNNWLYNAGLVGFLRILQAKDVGVTARLGDGGFELQAEDLEGFTDAYCKHVLQVALERLIPTLSRREDQKDLELLNSFGVNYHNMREKHLDQLRGELQEYDSIAQAEQLVKNTIEMIAVEINIAINKNFDEQKLLRSKSTDKAEKRSLKKQRNEWLKGYEKARKIVRDKVLKIKSGNNRQEIVTYINDQKYILAHLQQFYFNKDTVANPSLIKGQRRSDQFVKRFVIPAHNILKNNTKGHEEPVCKFCSYSHVTKYDPPAFDEGIFSIIGVSVNYFKNFFYNLVPDFFICDLCELILLCAWRGFNHIPWCLQSGDRDTEYLFVNLPSLPLLLEQNNRVQATYNQAQMPLQDTIYEDVMVDLFSEQRRKGRWMLQNILFVEIRAPKPSKRSDRPTFKYFHIGKDVADLFTKPEATKSFQRIRGRLSAPGDRKGTYSLQLKRETVKRFLSGDQVYDLTYQVCRQSLDNRVVRPESVAEMVFLHSLRDQIQRKYAAKFGINPEVVRGRAMEPRQVYGILRRFYKVGASLAQPMDLEKRQRLAYRLMSVVRSGKYAEFYDMLMRLYINAEPPRLIPDDLLSLLNPNDTIEFEAKAYALLSGFLGESQSASATDGAGALLAEEGQESMAEEGEDNG